MKATPTLKKVEVIAGCNSHWSCGGFRCRLDADAHGVTVRMKQGNRFLGEPGEELTFYKNCTSLDESLAFVAALPPSFGSEDAEQLGFKRTGWAILD